MLIWIPPRESGFQGSGITSGTGLFVANLLCLVFVVALARFLYVRRIFLRV
jgi:hypothetical protein